MKKLLGIKLSLPLIVIGGALIFLLMKKDKTHTNLSDGQYRQFSNPFYPPQRAGVYVGGVKRN